MSDADDGHYLDGYLAAILPELGLDFDTYAPYVTGYVSSRSSYPMRTPCTCNSTCKRHDTGLTLAAARRLPLPGGGQRGGGRRRRPR